MSAPSTEERLTKLEATNRQIYTGITGVLLAACLLLAAWNLFQSQSILRFGDIFDQMLNGKALPKISQFIIGHPTAHMLLAIALPIAAIAVFFTQGRRTTGIWLLLALVFITGFQALVTRFALWLPLYSIVSEMSSG